MKKNKMMRLASAMMVLTLMSTSVISGTFAKYVTSDSASDSARVAKWGVTVLASGSLFGENYESVKASVNKNGIAASVKGSVDTSVPGENIVAPGTQNNTGLILAVKGTPEVAYKVEMTTTADANKEIWLNEGTYGVMVDATAYANADNYTAYFTFDGSTYVPASADSTVFYELHDRTDFTGNEDGKYYPITWTVTKAAGSTGTMDTATYRSVTKMYNALNTEFSADEVAAGTATADVYTITWSWAFEQEYDGADTILGNLMADTASDNYKVVKMDTATGIWENVKAADYCLNVGFDATITATQVD